MTGKGNAQQESPRALDVLRLANDIHRGERSAAEVEAVTLWLQAGARQELTDSLRLRLDADPAESYARAVQVELSCWDPRDHAEGAVLAADWLADFGASHELHEYVQVRADWLGKQSGHRQAVEQRGDWGVLALVVATILAIAASLGATRICLHYSNGQRKRAANRS